jgi:hypothetical protein
VGEDAKEHGIGLFAGFVQGLNAVGHGLEEGAKAGLRDAGDGIVGGAVARVRDAGGVELSAGEFGHGSVSSGGSKLFVFGVFHLRGNRAEGFLRTF